MCHRTGEERCAKETSGKSAPCQLCPENQGGSQLGRPGNPTVPNHLQLPFKYWLSAAHCILLSLLGGGEGALGATGKD